MLKGATHAHLEPISYHSEPICYHSEPSDVPYSSNQFLGWDVFAASYSKTALAQGFKRLFANLASKEIRLKEKCSEHDVNYCKGILTDRGQVLVYVSHFK